MRRTEIASEISVIIYPTNLFQCDAIAAKVSAAKISATQAIIVVAITISAARNLAATCYSVGGVDTANQTKISSSDERRSSKICL